MKLTKHCEDGASPLIERRILASLERMALDAPLPRDRYEAIMAVGIIGYDGSLPTLERAVKDADSDVRKHASEAIDQINSASTGERSYDGRIRFWERLGKRND